jgi:hypothetical protein
MGRGLDFYATETEDLLVAFFLAVWIKIICNKREMIFKKASMDDKKAEVDFFLILNTCTFFV